MIEGVEWLIVAIFLVSFVVTVYLVASVQGDLRIKVESGNHDEEQAAKMFIDLVRNSRRSIMIHDDGNSSSNSMYNQPDVLFAVEQQIEKYPKL